VDTYLYLYNNAGTLLAANDDYFGLNSHIDYTLGGSGSAYSGDYSIAAAAFSGTAGTYSLRATLTTTRPINSLGRPQAAGLGFSSCARAGNASTILSDG
jgi:hypothetical protein